MTLLVSPTTYILASLHSHTSHTSTLSHLAWEFEKPFIISFITLHFIQPKINELSSQLWSNKVAAKKAQKKILMLQQDSSPWPLPYPIPVQRSELVLFCHHGGCGFESCRSLHITLHTMIKFRKSGNVTLYNSVRIITRAAYGGSES